MTIPKSFIDRFKTLQLKKELILISLITLLVAITALTVILDKQKVQKLLNYQTSQQQNFSQPQGYPLGCPLGTVALYEGGRFEGCSQPAQLEPFVSPGQLPVTPSNSGSQPAADPSQRSQEIPGYKQGCPAGTVALYEGGEFEGCSQPAQLEQIVSPGPSPSQTSLETPKSIAVVSPSSPQPAESPNLQSTGYNYSCAPGTVALYESGLFGGCETPAGLN